MAKLRRDKPKEPVVVAKGPEFTNVNDETERKIPLRTWWTCAFVSAVDIWAFVVILILASRQVWNWKHPIRAHGVGWWPSVACSLITWWPTIGIAINVGVILWSIPLLYRFLVETVAKHPPQYQPYPSEYGLWNPLGRPPLEDDSEEYEKDTKPPTINLKLWEMVRGKKRMREAPDLMVDTRARQFYRALAGGAASFSEREAGRYGIRPHEFKKYIRGPLMHQGKATWKDKRNHRLGVDLTDDVLVSLGHLGNAPTPPRNRA